jgi:hypothetical protein
MLNVEFSYCYVEYIIFFVLCQVYRLLIVMLSIHFLVNMLIVAFFIVMLSIYFLVNMLNVECCNYS